MSEVKHFVPTELITEEQVHKMVAMRVDFERLLEAIYERCPESRERSLAIAWAETSLMWANAAIARNPEA